MKIQKCPRQHIYLSVLYLLTFPIMFLNIWAVHKGNFQKFLAPDVIKIVAVATVWNFITFYLLFRVRMAGYYSALLFSCSLIFINIIYLIQQKNYALAFYGLFILIVSALYLMSIYQSLTEPYFYSGKRWFEGTPRLLPKLTALLYMSDGSEQKTQISRLNESGCFVCDPDVGIQTNPKIDYKKVNRIDISLYSQVLSLDVEMTAASRTFSGAGFYFLTHNQDSIKDLKDFMNRVRSNGYVD